MATINFYLDKTDKKGLAPIHLRINCNSEQVKLSTGEKIQPDNFNKETQLVKDKADRVTEINHYLGYLKERAEELFNSSYKKSFTNKEIKSKLTDFVKAYKEDLNVNIVREQVSLYGKPFTFVDLFAGAGGFSEGFIQAEHNNKFFDFILANDINENSELTHVVRYNHQLGLDADFSNVLHEKDGVLTGQVGGDMMFGFSKGDMIQRLQNILGISKADTLVCGDGANDLSMFEHADTRIAFCAREVLKKEANIIIDTKDLTQILKHI